jgi:type IV secretory pathway VirB10-like protein
MTEDTMRTIAIILSLAIGALEAPTEAQPQQKAAPEPAAPTASADPSAAAPAEQPSADKAAAPESDVAPEAAAANEVPTAEDFEEKAAAEVNKKNLETEVSRMEKELGAGAK